MSAKTKMATPIKVTAVIIASVAACYIVLVIIFAITGISGNEKAIEKAAKRKEALLSQLEIITGQPTIAKGEKNGDGLTGSVSGTFASAAFTTNGTVAERATEVRGNLKKDGFIDTEKPKEVGNPITGMNQVFTKGQDAITVTYELIMPYACPAERVCDYNGNEIPAERLFDVNTLANKRIKSLRVVYK